MCCWAGERWTTVALLGGRVGGRVVVNCLGAERERVGLLDGRELVYWAGERWMTVALLSGRGQDC